MHIPLKTLVLDQFITSLNLLVKKQQLCGYKLNVALNSDVQTPKTCQQDIRRV